MEGVTFVTTMGRVDDFRTAYQEIREDDDFFEWMGDAVKEEVRILGTGRTAKRFFPQGANVLDVLFLIGEWEKDVKWAVGGQIFEAFEQGHSWNEVAAVLGRSRQAVVKRHREWTGMSGWERRQAEGVLPEV